MRPSVSEQKSELLQQLILVYRKLINASYTSGLAAARQYGPDIMDLAGRLHELVPASGKLGRLCDVLLDVMWDEYVTNAKDLSYSRELAYREGLGAKAEVLEVLVAIEVRWERELLGGDEGGGGGSDGDFVDDGSFADVTSDGGSGDGTDDDEVEEDQEEEESRRALLAEIIICASPNLLQFWIRIWWITSRARGSPTQRRLPQPLLNGDGKRYPV